MALSTNLRYNSRVAPSPGHKVGTGTYLTDKKLNGVDLSHWNGEIDWPALKKTNITFIFMKATQGVTYVDHAFERNWITAKNYGFYRGAYHFYTPKDDPTTQAKHFLSVVKPEKGDILPVLDIEIAHGEDPEQLRKDIAIWIDTVKAAIGRYPIIYTDRGFWDQSIDTSFNHCPLWIAEWDNKHAPYLPKGWNKWVFWQYTNAGTLEGIPGAKGKTDLDWFQGDLNRLKSYQIR